MLYKGGHSLREHVPILLAHLLQPITVYTLYMPGEVALPRGAVGTEWTPVGLLLGVSG